ncbi:uncharacterized protein BP5553_04172 [Venustampulla echinocandica]|uniref:Peptidase A1 domain-containing protein n=1 Tax=Venustampulla echinocandica TaxID=2656787 RepID=A0A370TWC9_9HELO|nr:uncharacterized protein BP5553_04172 [Venustampulla echinocandica]RDL39832.1 hypothetical protein BP5553_04172 [Venustampulla echinocandica]
MYPVLRIVLLTQYLIGICNAVLDSVVVRGTGPVPPLVIPPSQYFEGNDGPWSTFNLRVGTPGQDVRVTISTASPETMVVLSEYGCSTIVFKTVPERCASSRGLMFSPNSSSTWSDKGFFGINQDGVGLEANLGYTQAANFGLDTLGLGMVAGANGPTLKNQTIAGIPSASPFYLGIFGLGTQPVNFSSLGNYSAPSYFTSLRDQNLIPSLSWSYTAGAKYRKLIRVSLFLIRILTLSKLGLKQVYGQLIFSGYDTSRFTSSPISFTIAKDLTRDIVVSLQSITYSGTVQTSLLASPILVFIDSTDPNLWLPEAACQLFEEAFGLTLDDATGLYLVNNSHHEALLSENAEVSFKLSDTIGGGGTVNIVLPYSAFDLKAEYPMVNNASFYFPLKKAANNTQYTLGRTFLQEAYLTVDYERGNFSVSPCSWVEGAAQNIVAISSKDSKVGNNTTPLIIAPGDAEPNPTSPKNGIDTGAIIGIVVGCAIFAILLALAGYFFLKRWKEKQTLSQIIESSDSHKGVVGLEGLESPEYHKLSSLKATDGELSNDSQIYQLHSEQMPRRAAETNEDLVRSVAYELPGSAVKSVGLDVEEGNNAVSR